MAVHYSEAVESALRTIEGAAPEMRVRAFEIWAPEAFMSSKIAGISKATIVDRLDAIAGGFGWSPDDRQRLITAAVEKIEHSNGGRAPPSDEEGVSEDDRFSDDGDQEIESARWSDDDAPRPPEFSDEAIALEFADSNRDLLYVAVLGKWFLWDGTRWRLDDTLLVRDKMRQTCRTIAARCGEKQERIAKGVTSEKTVAAALRLAQADRRIAATVEQFDRDLFMLNTPAGVVDLQSGRLAPHDREFYLTKITGVAPDFKMPTPAWEGFLRRITNGHDELIEYLRRVGGYCLTGDTREHALFFIYGVGANGKSTFANTITAAAGDYHRTAAIETFTSSSHDRHPTDLAGLRGARLVTAIETEEGRRWAESRIKALTGGDKIAARFMRQDFFEYVPQFKLLIAGNHKPGLRSVDEAIRRRFNLIPFLVTIPPNERDETLSDKLKAELPGILAWMIDGCADWLERGLAPPDIVRAATAQYLEAEDAVAAWLDELGERDGNSFTKTADLFASWSAWADKAGEYVGSAKRFAQALEVRGFDPHKHWQLGRGFKGIRLRDGPVGIP